MAQRPSIQLTVTLNTIRPMVWRTIQIPHDATFFGLHIAIQDAMGWDDAHLHEFRVPNPDTDVVEEIGLPVDGAREVIPGWTVPVVDRLGPGNTVAQYIYDFGDEWTHTVVFEGFASREKGVRLPNVVEGGGACPPEDCGGLPGYYEARYLVANPDHEGHADAVELLGEDFDPDRFDPAAVRFRREKTALKELGVRAGRPPRPGSTRTTSTTADDSGSPIFGDDGVRLPLGEGGEVDAAAFAEGLFAEIPLRLAYRQGRAAERLGDRPRISITRGSRVPIRIEEDQRRWLLKEVREPLGDAFGRLKKAKPGAFDLIEVGLTLEEISRVMPHLEVMASLTATNDLDTAGMLDELADRLIEAIERHDEEGPGRFALDAIPDP